MEKKEEPKIQDDNPVPAEPAKEEVKPSESSKEEDNKTTGETSEQKQKLMEK